MLWMDRFLCQKDICKLRREHWFNIYHQDKDFQHENWKIMVIFKCEPNMRALPITNLGYILELQKLINAVSSHLHSLDNRDETLPEGISDSKGKIISFQKMK